MLKKKKNFDYVQINKFPKNQFNTKNIHTNKNSPEKIFILSKIKPKSELYKSSGRQGVIPENAS